MQWTNTTNPRADSGTRTLFSSESQEREMEILTRFRLHVLGLYHSVIGPEWDSDGKCESDYLHHIEIVLSGRRQVIFRDEVLELEQGMAYYLPGNTPVARRYRERGELLYVKFRCEWLPGVDPLFDWPERRPLAIRRFNPDFWQSWLEPGHGPAGGNALMRLHGKIEQWMAMVLPDLGGMIARHLETHTQFSGVFGHIERELGAGLRIDALAKTYGTSHDTFAKNFVQATGMSPKEYVTRRLNQQAIHLVINSGLKMKEIADRLGFSDEFYFSRFFQRLNRVAPRAYRQRFRSGG
jgi:AraC-like DNA-binding protein